MSITERLANLKEAKEIGDKTISDEWSEVENVYPWAEEYRVGYVEASKVLRKKLLTLQENGIFEMLGEATGGVTLEIVAEPTERSSGINVVGNDGKNQGVYGNGWGVDVNRPCLERTVSEDGTRHYNWNTDVKIIVGQGIIDGKIFSPSIAQYVILEYSNDGTLSLQGEAVAFQGQIPTDEVQRTNILEDAFVNAFAYPNVVIPTERLVQTK